MDSGPLGPGEECQCQGCLLRQKVPGEKAKMHTPAGMPPPSPGLNQRPFPGAAYYIMTVLSVVIALVVGGHILVLGIIEKYYWAAAAALFPISIALVQATHLFCVHVLAGRGVPMGFRSSRIASGGLFGLSYHYLGWSGWFRVRRLARENRVCAKALLVQNIALVPMILVPVALLAAAIVCLSSP
jgi:lysylphosphatidylglycerol synthetase-like protein (DUF2156 family)